MISLPCYSKRRLSRLIVTITVNKFVTITVDKYWNANVSYVGGGICIHILMCEKSLNY